MFEIDLANSDRSKIENKQMMKVFVYVDKLFGTIKGACIVGEPAETLINMFTVLCKKKVTMFEMTDIIIPYPTYADGLNQLNSQFFLYYKNHIKDNLLSYLFLQKQRIIALSIWIIAGISLYRYLALENFNSRNIFFALNELLNSDIGIVIFIFAYIIRATLFLPATLLSILGGSIYGFWWGLIFTIIASNLSSAFAYFLGRTIFSTKEQVVIKSGFRNYIKNNTFEAVLIARLTYFPFDLVSYISGSLKVSFLPFIFATAIGALPGTVAITSFGASIENFYDIDNFRIQIEFVLIGIVIMIASILLSRWVKNKKNILISV